MQRAKKEALRKYVEKRQGKTPEEIALIDQEEAKAKLLQETTRKIHSELFSEEFDFMMDSISDVKRRRNGENPMSTEYINEVNERRIKLGVSPLGKDGKPDDNFSEIYAFRKAKELIG